jgi:pimeloyl-ACP methyl ester carboxylesterase
VTGGPGGPGGAAGLPPDHLDGLVATDLEHRLLDRSWGQQHVVLAGPRGAPGVLLVHGWPQHWLAWREVIPALAAEHQVVAVDLRGMGWSEDRTGARPSIDSHVADLLAVTECLGLDRPALVGHDWGGWIAFQTVMAAPARWSQVVGVSITPPWLVPTAVLRHAPVLSYTVAMALWGRRVARSPRLVARMLRRSAPRDPWRDDVGRRVLRSYQDRLARPSAGATTVGLYGELVRHAAWDAMRAGRRPLQCPATVVLGEAEPITTPDLFWGRTRPGELQLRTVPHAGHWLPEERPDELAAALLELLTSAQGHLEVAGNVPLVDA